MVKVRDLISPLRHLGPHNITEGAALQLDIAGPWTVFTKGKQYAGQLRGVKRTKTKMWLLLAIDYYSSRLECAALEDLTTGSVSPAIQEIVSSTGHTAVRCSRQGLFPLRRFLRLHQPAVDDLT